MLAQTSLCLDEAYEEVVAVRITKEDIRTAAAIEKKEETILCSCWLELMEGSGCHFMHTKRALNI